jgi:hydroxymethylpyrimidine pyrophosphatase-like HAD family hydrolase
MATLGAVFSDIDGTLVHYQAKLEKLGYTLDAAPDSNGHTVWRHASNGGAPIPCVPVPSLTLTGGFISVRTLDTVRQLRARGVKFVLMTGARTSTFLERRAAGALPEADYDAWEGGGRLKCFADPAVGENWTDRFASVVGDWRAQTDGVAPDARVGPLWDAYRALAERGYSGRLDGKSFGTAFMVDVREEAAGAGTVATTMGITAVGATEARLKALVSEELGPKHGVGCILNLAKAHIAPAGCGKGAAMAFVCEREDIAVDKVGAVVDPAKPYAAALFDDENDLQFAAACRIGYAPSIAHPSVLPAIEASEGRLRRTTVDGLLGIEEALTKLLDLAPPIKADL